ncbi:unnamed protein product [Withania somnifera]
MDDFSRRQASIKSVLTCRICKKLCKDVTIVDECCHRFCKKCITRKFTEERLKVCPECNLDLGVAPWQKIRPDHQVQGIRDILSAKRRECIERGLIQDKSKKVEPKKLAHENIDINSSVDMLIDDPPVPSPSPAAVATSSRRKEKSISSLVNTTPFFVDDHVDQNHYNVSTSTGRTGRRRRRGSSQNNANASVHLQDESSKVNNVVDLNKEYVQPESPTIPLLSGKAVQNKEQVENSTIYAAESSKRDKSREPFDGMNDLWEPLNKLVTKAVTLDSSNKSKSKEPVLKLITPVLINLDDDAEDDIDEEDEEYVPSPKTKEHKVREQHVVQKSNVFLVTSASTPAPSSSNDKGKGKKGRRGRKKKETAHIPIPVASDGDGEAGGSNINVAQVKATTKAATGTSSGTRVLKERGHPIWFTLVASDKQDCPSPLPQIPSRYIKIKDANMPSSYIKKYLAQKLSLQSQDEVEVRMLGMPIRPALPMQHLADLWSRSAPNSEKTVKIGASAQDFVMVLKYGRSQITASA